MDNAIQEITLFNLRDRSLFIGGGVVGGGGGGTKFGGRATIC